jgi:hypothetical protein
MGIFNRRYAVLGWIVWQIAKYAGKSKARQAVPGKGDYAGLNKGAIASILLLIGGVFWLSRKLTDDESTL